MAQIYAEKARDAIDRQSLVERQNWEPLSERYRRLKEKAGLSAGMWIRSGQLLDAIKAYKFAPAGVWSVGIPPQARYKEVVIERNDEGEPVDWSLGRTTDLKVLTVAKWLEFGTTNMPARPLFRPIQRRLRKGIRRFWEDYKSDLGLEAGAV